MPSPASYSAARPRAGQAVPVLREASADVLVLSEAAAAQPVPGFCPSCGNGLPPGRPACPRCGLPAYWGYMPGLPYAGYSPYVYYPRYEPRPSMAGPLASVLGLFFTMLVLHVGVGAAVAAGASPAESLMAAEFIDLVLVALWCVMVRRDVGPALTTAPPAAWVPAAIAMGGATFLFATAMMALLTQALRLEEVRLSPFLLQQGYGYAFLVAVMALQPAVVEELAFRGVIQSGLERIGGATTALVWSAAMFAFIHLSLPSFPHLFLMGLAAGWLRRRTGSLYPCMLLHFTHNFLCILTGR
jgi:membrane protease YdiL (CAAX protease family)